MIILDTDIISLVDIGGATSLELQTRIARTRREEICVTIISFEEQMRGWLSYIAASKTMDRQLEGYLRLHQMVKAYQHRRILDFDRASAREFERLRALRSRVGTMDLKIAATALASNAVLVTRNIADFRIIPGLHCEDWTRP